MEILCPSRDTTLNISFLTSKSSPVMVLLFSLNAIENMVCLMISLRENWEMVMQSSFSIAGR